MSESQTTTAKSEEYYREDEISLYDLYHVLVKRKNLIAIVLAAVLIVCGIYLLITPRIYQISAILLPPSPSDLYLTNIDVSKENKRKPADIFKLFGQEIISSEKWHDFTKAEKKLFPDASVNDLLDNPFKLAKDKDFPGEHTLVNFETTDRARSAEIVQHYLKFVEQRFTDSLIQQVSQDIKHQTKALELDIQFERQSARQQRMDKIAQLEADLAIAKKLNITENLFFNLAGKASDNKTGVFNVFTGNTTVPTYLRGSKVIAAELDSLRQRESDDPYIPTLRQKQDELVKLGKVRFTPDSFHPYRLDGEINKPRSPSKPRKKLVLLLGAVLGLFLGIFAAFVAEFVSKARAQENSPE
jgi:chain length determinant protein (polysaccharide antigen chain regulator)